MPTATKRSTSNYSGDSVPEPRNASGRVKPRAGPIPKPVRDASSQGRTASVKMSPIDQVTKKAVGSSMRQKQSAHGDKKISKGKSSSGHSPILSRKSCRYEEIENFYEQIVE